MLSEVDKKQLLATKKYSEFFSIIKKFFFEQKKIPATEFGHEVLLHMSKLYNEEYCKEGILVDPKEAFMEDFEADD